MTVNDLLEKLQEAKQNGLGEAVIKVMHKNQLMYDDIKYIYPSADKKNIILGRSCDD